MTSEETKFQPGDLICQENREAITAIGVNFEPHTNNSLVERDAIIYNGDLFLVLTGWVPVGLVGFRQMWCFRLNKIVWVNETYGCFLFSKVA